MDGYSISAVPPLRSPVVIVAFGGWSDTGTVTTDVVAHLSRAFDATQWLTVDPEDYYVFSEMRPAVKLDESGTRVIEWPRNTGFWARFPHAEHDLVLVSGVEPNLHWRTFSSQLTEALASTSPSLICTLVARPATTPHTRPIPVTGSAADPDLARRYGLGRSLYQGPTGIIGVLHDMLRQKDVSLISLAAGVPHYLNTDENPPATIALLKALEPVLGFEVPLGALELESKRFLERVEEASRADDQIMNYVRSLEESYSEVAPEGEPPLPSADDVVRDVEDFLRGDKED
ncbi:MAG: PAC2 family protein [Dehalococcoidia bacterium]|nr:PAC2 family protein [Dehalococcoidia bacterium]HJP40868.1 PAC2 family protein [Dehalococcoidia bacterium]